jgi:hypothetical protein
MTVWLRGLIGTGLLVFGIAVGRYTMPAGGPPVAASEELSPRLWEATVFLPLADNQGRRFAAEDWQRALDVLVIQFGGATLGQEMEGCWLDARRRVHREPVRAVTISFEDRRLGDFRGHIREVGRLLGQEAVYYRLERPHVELIRTADSGPERHLPDDEPSPAVRLVPRR